MHVIFLQSVCECTWQWLAQKFDWCRRAKRQDDKLLFGAVRPYVMHWRHLLCSLDWQTHLCFLDVFCTSSSRVDPIVHLKGLHASACPCLTLHSLAVVLSAGWQAVKTRSDNSFLSPSLDGILSRSQHDYFLSLLPLPHACLLLSLQNCWIVCNKGQCVSKPSVEFYQNPVSLLMTIWWCGYMKHGRLTRGCWIVLMAVSKRFQEFSSTIFVSFCRWSCHLSSSFLLAVRMASDTQSSDKISL